MHYFFESLHESYEVGGCYRRFTEGQSNEIICQVHTASGNFSGKTVSRSFWLYNYTVSKFKILSPP